MSATPGHPTFLPSVPTRHLPCGPILVLDARLAPARAGLWRDGKWLSLVESPGDPLDGLFAAVDEALAEVGLTLRQVEGFVCNTGPGSALAIRTTAIALATWRQLPGLEKAKVFPFNSLQLLAALTPLGESTAVAAAARQGLWHLCQREAGHLTPARPTLVDSPTLATITAGHRLVLPMSKQWETPPEGWTARVPTLDCLRQLFLHPTLLSEVAEPTLLEPPPSDYRTWSGARHR
jgi:hypothetical protein